MNRTPTLTITLQSDNGFTVGECLGVRGGELRGRAPHWLSIGEVWTFRLELPHGLGTVMGRLKVHTASRGAWRGRVVGLKAGDRVRWERWLSVHGRSAVPAAALSQRRVPASAITPEALAQARRSTPAPRSLGDWLRRAEPAEG